MVKDWKLFFYDQDQDKCAHFYSIYYRKSSLEQSGKEKKRHSNQKKTSKIVSVDVMIFYMESPNDSTKNYYNYLNDKENKPIHNSIKHSKVGGTNLLKMVKDLLLIAMLLMN